MKNLVKAMSSKSKTTTRSGRSVEVKNLVKATSSKSKTTTRSGRSVKPTKRMIEESSKEENPSPKRQGTTVKKNPIGKSVKTKSRARETKTDMEVKKTMTTRGARKKTISSTPSEMIEPESSTTVKSVSKVTSDASVKHVPIYMRSEKNDTNEDFSLSNLAPDPYEELDYLALEDEEYYAKKKKKTGTKGANLKKRKPRKAKAEMILMFGSSKKVKETHQAVKDLKNLQTPSQEVKKKQFKVPKIVIEEPKPGPSRLEIPSGIGKKSGVKTFVIEEPNDEVFAPDIPSHEEVHDEQEVESIQPSPPTTKRSARTPIVSSKASKFVPERKASTPKTKPNDKPPTKQELIKKCFGFDDSSTEGEDEEKEKPKNDSINFSPMQNVRSSFIQMTPAQPSRIRNRNVSASSTTSTNTIKGPMRFDLSQTNFVVKSPVKSRSKFIQRSIKPSKPSVGPEQQNEVSQLFEDPIGENCDDGKEDLNAFEVLGKGPKKIKVSTKKPLKTITNTGNPQKNTTQSLIYEKADNGQKRLRSKRKVNAACDEAENDTAPASKMNISKTYERADALNCSITAHESPKKAKKNKKVESFI